MLLSRGLTIAPYGVPCSGVHSSSSSNTPCSRKLSTSARMRPSDTFRPIWACTRSFGINVNVTGAELSPPKTVNYRRLPEPAHRGDAHATGGVCIRVEVEGCGLAQKAPSASPKRAAMSACIPALSELPWAQSGS